MMGIGFGESSPEAIDQFIFLGISIAVINYARILMILIELILYIYIFGSIDSIDMNCTSLLNKNI